MNYKILNSKEKKELMKKIDEQWGVKDFDFSAYAFLQKKDGKIFIINREVELVLDKRINIDAMGLYFAEVKSDGREKDEIRLSIEGSFMIGPIATKNILEISVQKTKELLKGFDIDISDMDKNEISDLFGFVILKNGSDYFGSGKYKDGKILNFVPKTRRILSD